MVNDSSKRQNARQAQRQASELAKSTLHVRKSSYSAQDSTPETGRPVYGVRERTGEYGSPQEPSEEKEESRQIKNDAQNQGGVTPPLQIMMQNRITARPYPRSNP